MFASVQAEPVDKQNFKVHYNIPKEGDIGSEQPPTILYYPKDSKGYVEGMAVTDLSLCKTNDQKTTCQLFLKMLSQRPWDIGTDVTDTRISGSDYRTAFLETIDSVQVSNVDSFVAFIGADSQDPPSSEIVLYVYAQKGTNLIQLTIPVSNCKQPVAPGISDASFYKRYCVTSAIMDKADAKGKTLTDVFRLK